MLFVLVMMLISTKEKLDKRMAYDELTKHIRAHLVAAKHEKFGQDTDGTFKGTFATVGRYLNAHGRDLPKTKLRVNAQNIRKYQFVWVNLP